nr:MAG TPA: hypothetical protein [Caudoviricetes sp.]
MIFTFGALVLFILKVLHFLYADSDYPGAVLAICGFKVRFRMLWVHELEHEVICCIHEIFCVSGGIIFLNTPFHCRKRLYVSGLKVFLRWTIFIKAGFNSILPKLVETFTVFFCHIEPLFYFLENF